MNLSPLRSTKSIHQDPSKYGSIQLKTDKLTYCAGESVSGEIYIEIFEEIPEVQLFLRFEGREGVTIVNNVTDGTGKLRRMLQRNQRTILTEGQNIFNWDTLSPGHYIIPFTFLLPRQIPATFYEEFVEIYSGFIRYKLQASLKLSKIRGMHIINDVNIVIRDRPHITLEPISQEIKTNLTTYCCCSKGTTGLKVHFEKNHFSPGEVARAAVEFDNSQSKLDNTKISFSLKQRLRLLNGYGYKNCTKICAAQWHNGVIAAGSASTNIAFEITFPNFRGDDHDLDTREQKWPAGTITDMGTSTQSRFIGSHYYLEVDCPMQGSTTFAKVICPIYISYPEPQAKQITLPSNWEPKQLLRVNVAFMFNKVNQPLDREGKEEEVPSPMVNSAMPNGNNI